MKQSKLSCWVKFVTIAAVAFAIPATIHAANVSQTADDGFGTSSFDSAGTWDNALPPSAGNDYFNAGFLLRTPADTGNYTFAGDSLTITGPGLASGVGNDALMWKGSGTTAIITVNNLTIDGGQLRHGQSSADTFTLEGTLAIGVNGANFATQGGMIIDSAISGSSTIRVLDSGNTDATRLITIGSGLNTFTGNIELAGSAADRTRVSLADGANLDFVIGASGVNNSITGTGTFTYNGTFDFDLSGASATVGDVWHVANASAQSFGSTFSVNGFVDMGGGYWASSAVGPAYEFDPTSGTLSYVAQAVVPEPGTVMMLLSGLGMLLGINRFRKA